MSSFSPFLKFEAVQSISAELGFSEASALVQYHQLSFSLDAYPDAQIDFCPGTDSVKYTSV